MEAALAQNKALYTDISTEALSKTMKTSVRIANVQTEIRTRCLPNTSLEHCHSRQLAWMGLSCITLCCCGRLMCTRSVCNYEPWNCMQSFFNFRMSQKQQLLPICYHRYAWSTSHDHWDAGVGLRVVFHLYIEPVSPPYSEIKTYSTELLSAVLSAHALVHDTVHSSNTY
jgi:hypothetical protein